MSEPKHTPGPWSLQRKGTPLANNRVWPATGCDPICSLSSMGSSPADCDAEAQANGHLIVAAPDLYEAGEKVLSYLNALIDEAPADAKPVFFGHRGACRRTRQSAR